MSAVADLEKTLDDVYKKAPALPESGRKLIVEWLPWITLVFGVLTLWSAFWLWQWAHALDKWVDLANSVSSAYGGAIAATGRMNFFVWLSLGAMLVQAVIYLMASSPLKDRNKKGWDLLFYAGLVSLAVGLIGVFIGGSYGGFSRLFGTLLGSAIGFYFLFQIRSYYLGKPVAAKAESKAPAAHTNDK
jgi:magnesium-transporting ATPase (P-type)